MRCNNLNLFVAVAAGAVLIFSASTKLAWADVFENLNWLETQYWKPAMAQGLVTLNKRDLKRFKESGAAKSRLLIQKYTIITTSGKYFDGIFKPTETDQPASVYVIHQGEVVAGGKGLDFSVEFQDPDLLKITHWDGKPDCSLGRYWLRLFKPEIQLVGTEYLDYLTGEQCTP